MNSETRLNSQEKKHPKPNNIITIPFDLDDISFYRWWCIFMKPFVNLTNKEIEVMACFLKIRWDLSKDISDPAILDTVLMGEMTKKKIIAECKITLPHFYVIMSNLRKHKVIIGNNINPRLIPNQRPDDNGYFQLLILFKGNKQSA